jgi:hypothetical protein
VKRFSKMKGRPAVDLAVDRYLCLLGRLGSRSSLCCIRYRRIRRVCSYRRWVVGDHTKESLAWNCLKIGE